jgi:mRNA interferase MazF
MTRGEIWWADFGVPLGSEPGYRRPVLIVQDDSFNDSLISTTIVIPLTTNLRLAEAPGNILLTQNATGLSKDSAIVVSQVGVIDKGRLIEYVSDLSNKNMKRVEIGLNLVLGL